MEADQAVCCGSDCPHPPSLWGEALPCRVVGEGVKVPCRARWEQPAGIPLAAGAGWTGVLWSEGCCTLTWSLPVVLVACLSLFPGPIPPAFAEGRGGFFS